MITTAPPAHVAEAQALPRGMVWGAGLLLIAGIFFPQQQVLDAMVRAGLPVSSTKSYLAHAQGAAGVLELIATLLAQEHAQVLPTLHLKKKRRRAPDDPVAQATPRDHAWSHALSTNSAFGGANASVCVSRLPSARPARARREVFVSGAGVVGPRRSTKSVNRSGCATADPAPVDPSQTGRRARR
jgi:hypothetical protein